MSNRDRVQQARTRRTIGEEGEKVPFRWTRKKKRKNARPARIRKWTGESSATNRLSQIVLLRGRFRGHRAIVLEIVTHGVPYGGGNSLSLSLSFFLSLSLSFTLSNPIFLIDSKYDTRNSFFSKSLSSSPLLSNFCLRSGKISKWENNG